MGHVALLNFGACCRYFLVSIFVFLTVISNIPNLVHHNQLILGWKTLQYYRSVSTVLIPRSCQREEKYGISFIPTYFKFVNLIVSWTGAVGCRPGTLPSSALFKPRLIFGITKN